MSQDTPEEASEKLHAAWANAIGRLMIAFGEIEWFTYSIVDVLAEHSAKTKLLKQPLRSRIESLAPILENASIPDDLKRKIQEMINAAAQFIDLRNAIAHNPMRFVLYEDDQGNHHVQTEINEFESVEDPITYKMIDDARHSLEEMVSECHFLAGRLYFQSK